MHSLVSWPGSHTEHPWKPCKDLFVQIGLPGHAYATPTSLAWCTQMKSLRRAEPYLQGDTHCPIAEQENGLWLECFQMEMDVPFLSLWETVPPEALTTEPCGSTCENNQRCHLHVNPSNWLWLIANPWVASRVIAHFIEEEMRRGVTRPGSYSWTGHHLAQLPLAPGTLVLGPSQGQEIWAQTIKIAGFKPEM